MIQSSFRSDFAQECRAAIVCFSRYSEQSLNRHINAILLIDFKFPTETDNDSFMMVVWVVVVVVFV